VPHPCLFAEDHLKGLVSMEIAPSIEREVPDFARDLRENHRDDLQCKDCYGH
jgi:hypothetical protein